MQEDERRDPFWLCRTEHQCNWSSIANCEERGACRLDGIKDGKGILLPVLNRQRRSWGRWIGESDAAGIKPDEPREGRQSLIEPAPVNLIFSVDPDIAAAVERQQIDRAITSDLVADVEVIALGIANARAVHGWSL